MSSIDGDLLSVLLDIKADVAATKEAVINIAGPTGRLTVLENNLANQAKFQKWYNYAIVPALASVHELARYLGIKI